MLYIQYKLAVNKLKVLEDRIKLSNELVQKLNKLPKSNGERHKFFKENEPFIFRNNLEADNLKLDLEKVIDDLEKSEIGFDLTPTEMQQTNTYIDEIFDIDWN